MAKKMVPGFRSRNRAVSGAFAVVGWCCVRLWQRRNWRTSWAHTHKPVGKRLVYVNLDETCIRMYIESWTPGLVRVPSGARKVNVLEKKLKASLSQQRSAVSLIACATDDEEAARLLPQIFLTNDYVLNKTQIAILTEYCSARP